MMVIVVVVLALLFLRVGSGGRAHAMMVVIMMVVVVIVMMVIVVVVLALLFLWVSSGRVHMVMVIVVALTLLLLAMAIVMVVVIVIMVMVVIMAARHRLSVTAIVIDFRCRFKDPLQIHGQAFCTRDQLIVGARDDADVLRPAFDARRAEVLVHLTANHKDIDRHAVRNHAATDQLPGIVPRLSLIGVVDPAGGIFKVDQHQAGPVNVAPLMASLQTGAQRGHRYDVRLLHAV